LQSYGTFHLIGDDEYSVFSLFFFNLRLNLHSGHLADAFIQSDLQKSTFVDGDSNISLRYIKIRIEQVSSIHSCKVNSTSFIIARLPA